jgi:hypothetical protein
VNDLIATFAGSPWLRPYLFVQDLAISVVLCLPLAALICLLRPRNLVAYVAATVVASLAWMVLAYTAEPLLNSLLMLSASTWLQQILPVPLAAAVLSRWIGSAPPNNTLETDVGETDAAQLHR